MIRIRICDKKTGVIKEWECPEDKLGECGVYGQLRLMLRKTPILNDRDYEININHLREKKIVGTTTVNKAFERFMLDQCPDVKKKLNAFEIIKEKEVDISSFKSCLGVGWDYALFEKYCGDNSPYEENPPYQHSMTQEEFDLLKEELK